MGVRQRPHGLPESAFGYAYSQGHVSIAEQVGVRRETLWRYKTGAVRAPFKTLVKIMAAVGVKLVVARC
jgi:DNA-binding phage protein